MILCWKQIGEIITRWENINRRRRSEQPQYLGLGEPNAKDQSGIDLERASLLRFGYLPRLESLLQLLQRREHRRLGYTESISAQTIPRSHGRRLLHRHIGGRVEIVDRRTGQHRYSRSAIALPASGSRWEWKTRTSRCYMPRNRTNISSICTSLVYFRYVSLPAVNGSFRRARIISSTRGAHLTGPRYSRWSFNSSCFRWYGLYKEVSFIEWQILLFYYIKKKFLYLIDFIR